VYTFVESEELLDFTAIDPAGKFCYIINCHEISSQALGSLYDFVGSSPPSIECGDISLRHLDAVHESQVANWEINNLEVDCFVDLFFVGISQLL